MSNYDGIVMVHMPYLAQYAYCMGSLRHSTADISAFAVCSVSKVVQTAGGEWFNGVGRNRE